MAFAEPDSHIQLCLVGLNRTVMIECVMKLPPELPEAASFGDVLLGKCSAPAADPARQGSTSADELLTSAAELRNKRLLCVLDLYSYGHAKTEIILNRAFTIAND